MNPCHYTFLQTHKTPSINTKLNYQLQVTVMCSHRFLSYNKRVLPVGFVDGGECQACTGQRVCSKPLSLPLSFAVNLKVF